MFVHSEKGSNILNLIDIDLLSVKYDEAIKNNPAYYTSVAVPYGRV